MINVLGVRKHMVEGEGFVWELLTVLLLQLRDTAGNSNGNFFETEICLGLGAKEGDTFW